MDFRNRTTTSVATETITLRIILLYKRLLVPEGKIYLTCSKRICLDILFKHTLSISKWVLGDKKKRVSAKNSTRNLE